MGLLLREGLLEKPLTRGAGSIIDCVGQSSRETNRYIFIGLKFSPEGIHKPVERIIWNFACTRRQTCFLQNSYKSSDPTPPSVSLLLRVSRFGNCCFGVVGPICRLSIPGNYSSLTGILRISGTSSPFNFGVCGFGISDYQLIPLSR